MENVMECSIHFYRGPCLGRSRSCKSREKKNDATSSLLRWTVFESSLEMSKFDPKYKTENTVPADSILFLYRYELEKFAMQTKFGSFSRRDLSYER